MSIVIQSLATGYKTQILTLGGVRRATHSNDFPKIAVYLRSSSGRDEPHTPYEVRDVEIGAIAALGFGTHISGIGEILSTAHPQKGSRRFEIELDVSAVNCSYVSLGDRISLFGNNQTLEAFQSDSRCNTFYLRIGHKRFGVVLIPCNEVFRHAFAESSTLATEVVDGSFGRPDLRLWDEKRSRLEGRSPFLMLRHHMHDVDALPLAVFACSNCARERANQIHAALVAGWYQKQEYVGIKAAFPYEGRHKFVFHGFRHREGLLIHRIESSDVAPPFDSLFFDRENSKSETSEGGGERQSGPRNPPGDKPSSDGWIVDSPPRSNGVIPHFLPERAENPFPGRNVTLEKIVPPVVIVDIYVHDETGSSSTEPPEPRQPKDSSLGKPSSGDGDIKKALITEPEPAVLPGPDDPMWTQIHKLEACKEMGLIETLTYAEVLDVTALQGSVCFNIFKPEVRGRAKAWLFADAARLVPRTCVVATITLKSSYFVYWIEIQKRQIRRKASTDDGFVSVSGASNHSSIVFGRKDGKALGKDRLKEVLLHIAEHNGPASGDKSGFSDDEWVRRKPHPRKQEDKKRINEPPAPESGDNADHDKKDGAPKLKALVRLLELAAKPG